MINDFREPLNPGARVIIGDHTVTIGNERDRGGSCIVYDGIYNGEDVIVKEFHPVSLGLKRRPDSDELDISPDNKKDFNIQKSEYIKGSEAFDRFSLNNRDHATERIIGKGEANHTYYYFAYTDQGQTLSTVINERADFSLEKAVRIMLGICTVISKIHKEGKLYLDLKPSNIWYLDPSDDDNVYIRLFDFDTVIRKNEINERADFVPKSTVGYAADELIYNQTDKISYCTDVYAIGMVFYWLLTGENVRRKSIEDITLDDSWMNESGCLIYKNKTNDDKTNREIKEEILKTLKDLLEYENRSKKENDNRDSVKDVISTEFRTLRKLIKGANYKYDIKKDIIEDVDKALNEFIKIQEERNSFFLAAARNDLPENIKGYSYEDEIPFPVFNSVYDHPVFGDERAFIQIRESGDTKWHRNIKLVAGKQYEVDVFFRNDASEKYNGSKYDEKGISRGTKMTVDLPSYIEPNQKDTITVKISSNNLIQDCKGRLELTADEPSMCYLRYIPDSCIMRNNRKLNGEVLPQILFRTTKGLYIGTDELNGELPGGDMYAGNISFSFAVSLKSESGSYNAGIQTDSKADWEPKERSIFSRHYLPGYVTFNSVVDDLQFGDERYFVRIADLGVYPPSDYLENHPDTVFRSSMEIVPGRTYAVKIIVHNNPSVELNYREHKGVGIALDVRVGSSFTKEISAENDGYVAAAVSSSNAKPKIVRTKAALSTKSAAGVHLKYVPGSAVIHNSGKLNGTHLSPDYLFSERGIYLGFNKFSGTMPGGNDFACYLTYLIRATQVASKVEKYVSKDGTVFKKRVSARVGDVLTFKIEFFNTGSEDIPGVVFHDIFPACLELIRGSTMVINNSNPNGVKMVDTIDKNGFCVGLYGPGSSATVIYKARIIDSHDKLETSGKKKYYENRSFVDYGETDDQGVFHGGEITDKATFTIEY